jgi:peptidoglycan hydrolase CwlO-like protein
MKKLPLILTPLASLAALPVVAEAKDKDKKDRDEEHWKKESKDAQHDVHELEQEFSRVQDRVRNSDTGRGAWQQLQAIGAEVNRLRAQVERGSYDPRELRARIRQANESLDRLTQQVQAGHPNRSQGGYDIERRGEGNRGR